MSDVKIYTIAFDEKKNLFRLVPETGRVMRVKSDHKKFEWLKKQEPAGRQNQCIGPLDGIQRL